MTVAISTEGRDILLKGRLGITSAIPATRVTKAAWEKFSVHENYTWVHWCTEKFYFASSLRENTWTDMHTTHTSGLRGPTTLTQVHCDYNTHTGPVTTTLTQVACDYNTHTGPVTTTLTQVPCDYNTHTGPL